MTFKPALWQPIAVVLSAINLVAVGLAAGAAEPYHAAIHAGLAVGFGLWAQRLRQRRAEVDALPAVRDDRLEALEAALGGVQGELGEVQERLDFTERMLAQRDEVRRVEPER
jgi:hypothetical protein